MLNKFLCGCDLPSVDRLQGDPKLTSLATCVYDAEGFLVCMVHHMRRYGWRVPGHKSMSISLAGATDLEYERLALFGEKISRPSLKIRSTVTDRRDNRDPQEIGNHLLAMGSRPSNYPQNGKTAKRWFGCICDKRLNSSPGDSHSENCLEYNRKQSDAWELQEEQCSGSGYAHKPHGKCSGYTTDRT